MQLGPPAVPGRTGLISYCFPVAAQTFSQFFSLRLVFWSPMEDSGGLRRKRAQGVARISIATG